MFQIFCKTVLGGIVLGFFLVCMCWPFTPLSLPIYDNYFKVKNSESFLKEIYFPLGGGSGNCSKGRPRIKKHLKIMCFKKEVLVLS